MDKLRGVVAKVFVFILFSLLIASFAVWGIGDIFRGRADRLDVVVVGDTGISQEQYRFAVARAYTSLQRQLGQQIDFDRFAATGMPQQILAEEVTRALLDEQAKRFGMVAPDGVAAQEIQNTPAFQDADGNYNRRLVETYLANQQISLEYFEADVRRTVLRRQLINAFATGADAPDPLVEALFKFQQEKRIANFVTVERESLSSLLPEAREEELQDYYERNESEYLAPEYREATLVEIDLGAIEAGIELSDEELKSIYDSRVADFQEPERRHLLQVALEDEAQGQSIRERVAAGEDFETVVSEVTGSSPIDLGFVAQRDLAAPLDEAAFALASDSISEPLETLIGWQLLFVKEVQEASQQSFDTIKEELAAEVKADRALGQATEIANALDDSLASGASLEEASQAVGLAVLKLPPTDNSGLGQDGLRDQDVPRYSAFVEQLFATQVGEQSLLTEDGEGGYFLLRVDGVVPAAPRPLEEVREEVFAGWRAETLTKIALDTGDLIAQRVRDGESLEAIAEAEGFILRTSDALARNSREPSAQLVATLFDMAQEEVASVASAEGAIVAQLVEIVPADLEGAEAQLEELRASTRNDLVNEIGTLYTQALQNAFGVQVNNEALNQSLEGF